MQEEEVGTGAEETPPAPDADDDVEGDEGGATSEDAAGEDLAEEDSATRAAPEPPAD
jgi:hypothetical protein